MKKLIFSLMTLLMAAPALAEEAVQEASLLQKGLIVTAGGLGGVFLVLILFFLMIKVMHKLLE